MRLQKILRTRVTYQTEIPIHYPTAEEIHRTGVGRCDGVVLYGIQLMRAAGIPTVAEHTIWTRRNGEHYWCAFLNEDGRFLPFAPEYEGFLDLQPNQAVLDPGQGLQIRIRPLTSGNDRVDR